MLIFRLATSEGKVYFSLYIIHFFIGEFMKRLLLVVLLVVCTLFHSEAAKKSSRQEQKRNYEPGVLIVKLKKSNTDGTQGIQSVSALNNLQNTYQLQAPAKLYETTSLKKRQGVEELERVYTFHANGPVDMEQLAAKVSQNPAVEYAQPNYVMDAFFTPNDPLLSSVYPLGIVNASAAWDVQKGDSTIIIAVIDTGVDWDHPDLAAAIWKNKNEIPDNNIDDDGNGFIDDVRGWDFVSITPSGIYPGEDSVTADNNPMDFNGHGTHCSGIAAGVTNNGVGIASIGGGCTIMPLRIGWTKSDGGGSGYTSSMSKAFIYAANNGADVATLSFGSDLVSAEGAKYAYKNGVVVLNAAGNQNVEDVSENATLGAQTWALSVAATNSADNKASYSSFGPEVDIAAPGGDFSSGNQAGFLSTVVNPSPLYSGKLYEEFQGTSMATPMVAGLAGLIKSKHKDWTPAQIMFQITGTADNIDAKNPKYIGKLGAGRINAFRAVTETPVAPSPKLVMLSYTINDAAGGNGNGILEPGESADIIVNVRNDWGDANNLSATLATNSWTTSVTTDNSSYGYVYGISKIDSTVKSNSSNPFKISVSAEAIPVAIPFTATFTANDGAFTQKFDFSINIGARLLLVDDDDGSVNVDPYYTNALKQSGTVYDIWDHSKQGTPSASVLQNYQAVIWLCEWAFPTLDSSDRSSISSYLNAGGKLFLSGQDIGWDLCDPTGPENENSGGASKVFFETYLKSKFVADDAANDNMIGVAGDSIGNGLSFTRKQVERGASQYPDVIDTTGGSKYAFVYGGGNYKNRGGAITYSGNYKLAYFGFGGYESITDSVQRFMVMQNVLKWLFEYSIVADKLPNTENTTDPYPLNVTVSSHSTIQNVSLYWDNDGELPFNKLAMSFANGKYSASIPAQSGTKTVEYFALVKTQSGFLPYLISKFVVGPDNVPPVLTITDTLQNSLKLQGPYSFAFDASDDIGIDTANSLIHFSVNGGAEQTAALTGVNGKIAGVIVPSSALNSSDKISYYVTVQDAAKAKNVVRYPATGVRQFIIGKEIVDDCENPNAGKWNFGLWAYTSKNKYSGNFSLTDSPDSTYLPNQERIAVLINGYNLTPFTTAVLRYYRRHVIDVTDTCYVEASNNGTTWSVLAKYTGNKTTFTKEDISLNNFIGAGNSDVKIRLRFKSDAAGQKDGIYFDNIEILTNDLIINAVAENNSVIPEAYSLQQNYPNPFNPSTTIAYVLPSEGHVLLTVYDLLGRKIMDVVNEVQQAGVHKVQFDAAKLSTGIYFYKISAGNFSAMKKMLLLK